MPDVPDRLEASRCPPLSGVPAGSCGSTSIQQNSVLRRYHWASAAGINCGRLTNKSFTALIEAWWQWQSGNAGCGSIRHGPEWGAGERVAGPWTGGLALSCRPAWQPTQIYVAADMCSGPAHLRKMAAAGSRLSQPQTVNVTPNNKWRNSISSASTWPPEGRLSWFVGDFSESPPARNTTTAYIWVDRKGELYI